MSERATDLSTELSKVIGTQRNRIRHLEREVAQLEDQLTLARSGTVSGSLSGTLSGSLSDFEAAMEERFPDELQAIELSRAAADVDRARAAGAPEEAKARKPRRATTGVAISR